jgi:hypothetical protein
MDEKEKIQKCNEFIGWCEEMKALFRGQPQSIGYGFTLIPRLDAIISEVNSAKKLMY